MNATTHNKRKCNNSALQVDDRGCKRRKIRAGSPTPLPSPTLGALPSEEWIEEYEKRGKEADDAQAALDVAIKRKVAAEVQLARMQVEREVMALLGTQRQPAAPVVPPEGFVMVSQTELDELKGTLAQQRQLLNQASADKDRTRQQWMGAELKRSGLANELRDARRRERALELEVARHKEELQRLEEETDDATPSAAEVTEWTREPPSRRAHLPARKPRTVADALLVDWDRQELLPLLLDTYGRQHNVDPFDKDDVRSYASSDGQRTPKRGSASPNSAFDGLSPFDNDAAAAERQQEDNGFDRPRSPSPYYLGDSLLDPLEEASADTPTAASPDTTPAAEEVAAVPAPAEVDDSVLDPALFGL